MEIAGYIASIFIGITLGLIGGGGSILTVPVLVYLFSIDAVLATSYSLFIVGVTSLVGSISYFKRRLVAIKTAVIFGIPSIVAVFLTRAFIVPFLPEELFNIGSFTVTKRIFLLLLFAFLMVFASHSMIKKGKEKDYLSSKTPSSNTAQIIIQGSFVGIVTGLVGAGGGFLIIPALVNFLHLEIKKAIGTSLIVIALNSLFGFFVSVTHLTIHWLFLSKILILAITGVLIGSFLSKKIDGSKLKPVFGWFVLVMGIYIIVKETVL